MPIFKGKVLVNEIKDRVQHRIRQLRVMACGFMGRGYALQQMHTDTEMPLFGPNAGQIQSGFII